MDFHPFSNPDPPGPSMELDDFPDDRSTVTVGGGRSPGSKRCPTFKDLSSKIKTLEGENFQLRLRIYLSDRGSLNHKDLTPYFPKEQHKRLEQYLKNCQSQMHSTSSSPSASTIGSARSTTDALKQENDELSNQLSEYSNKIQNYEMALREERVMNEELMQKIDDMKNEIVELKTDLDMEKRKKIAEDIDHGAMIAFGPSLDDLQERNFHLENDLAEQQSKVKKCLVQIESMKQTESQLLSSESLLKDNNSKLQNKMFTMMNTIKELSKKIINVEEEFTTYKTQMNNQNKALESVCKLAGMLRPHLIDLTNFTETLLKLKSDGVLSITGLTKESQELLHVSINFAKSLSQNIIDVVSNNGESAVLPELLLSQCAIQKKHPACGDSDQETENGQCLTTPYSQIDSELITSLSNRNKEIKKLSRLLMQRDKTNQQLSSENSLLLAEVKTMKANIHALRSCNVERQYSESAVLISENKQLKQRLNLSQSALHNLHEEHAQLIGELKQLKHKGSMDAAAQFIARKKGPSSDEPLYSNMSTSPDLGIDSGHDGANSDDSNGSDLKRENLALRSRIRELAMRLDQTKQVLDVTMAKYNNSETQRNNMEKVVCRKLHSTHNILKKTRKELEQNASIVEGQENMKMPVHV